MHLLVANPTAQSGKNAERIERARALLHDAGVQHEFLATAPHGATVGLVAKALDVQKYNCAIYMGGDGTFAEVAKGILQSGRDVPLAMLPTGTANDQGKSFGLYSDEESLPRNVAVIAAGATCALDVGRMRALDDGGRVVREDRFFDSAGWGISPRVLKLRNEDRKAVESVPVLRDLWRDQLVYAGALLRTFIASYVDDDKFDVEVSADGARVDWRGLTDLVVKGTRIYGGAWVFDPGARPDDGAFEIVPFAGKRDWLSKAIVHLDESGTVADGLAAIGVTHSPSLRAGRIELRFRAREVPLAAQIDGEEFPATPRVEITVEPRALTLIVPEKWESLAGVER
jgi:diacylglycerol kinase family enzyme